MGNIPEVYQLQAVKKHLEMAKAFQDEMGALFFEHTMYDVKDALTSILALCDMADMKQIPQVKKYIQRVTALLGDVRIYHENSFFNLNHVIVNVINIVKKKYRSKISFEQDLAVLKASTKSNQIHLEQVLLFILIEAVESRSEPLSVWMEMLQKERDAVLTVRLNNFHLLPKAIEEVRKFHDTDAFRMQINTDGHNTELVIRLPLSFESKNNDSWGPERSHEIKLSAPQKQPVYGAQERT